MEKIILKSLKLNFTPNTLGCYGLTLQNRNVASCPRSLTDCLRLLAGPLSLPRSSHSPAEARIKRLRRLSSEDDLDMSAPGAGGGPSRDKTNSAEVAYYSQSPASLSSQTSWHSDVEHAALGKID